MFIRVKSTKNSPRKSVQIVESKRINGKVRQKIVLHVGVAQDEKELEELKLLAKAKKEELEKQGTLPLYEELDKKEEESLKKQENDENKIKRKEFEVNLLDLVEEKRVIKGIHDIYGKLYDEMGFNKVLENPVRNKASARILKEIVLARIANPDSKRGSVDSLANDFGVNLDLTSVYRMMDKLTDKAILKLNKLVYDKTKTILDDKIDVIYFDATTLYFECFEEDEFRKKGFSKDNKFNQPQVVLALLVTKQGLPIGYKEFSGDTFDGHTLLPSLEEVKKYFKIDNVVYVADSGMFNNVNLSTLKEKKISYIVGARIKSMKKELKKEILNNNGFIEINDDIKVKTIQYSPTEKLIITYSKKRAKKDKYDRDKAIEKLYKRLKESKSVKSQLSNNGYKKYLQLVSDNNSNNNSCDLSIQLNEDKIKEDEQWDGLKGIITNKLDLSTQEIINQYTNLWQVEESFRITKHDLKIRPIYHYKPQRVKAHLAISFMAYSLVRHLEYRVRLQYKKLSPEKIRKLLLSSQGSIYYNKKTDKKYYMPSYLSTDTKKIYKLMEVKPITTATII